MRDRLQKAALELYRDRGYDQVTAAEIAAAAGVTERTFFRHFADKREILFGGEEPFRDLLVAGVVGAPAGSSPLEALRCAFGSAVGLLESNRPLAEPRRHVIAATPALYERELAKTAGLTAALANALKVRGVEAGAASLAAWIGMATLAHALNRWFDGPPGGLASHLDVAFGDLEALVPATA